MPKIMASAAVLCIAFAPAVATAQSAAPLKLVPSAVTTKSTQGSAVLLGSGLSGSAGTTVAVGTLALLTSIGTTDRTTN